MSVVWNFLCRLFEMRIVPLSTHGNLLWPYEFHKIKHIRSQNTIATPASILVFQAVNVTTACLYNVLYNDGLSISKCLQYVVFNYAGNNMINYM